MAKDLSENITIKTKIKLFEDKVHKAQNFIKNQTNISKDEEELLHMSFETLLMFVENKSKGL
ncbi:hypothetical protein [Sulfurimonas sp.]